MTLEFDPTLPGPATLNGKPVILQRVTVETRGPYIFRGAPVDYINHRSSEHRIMSAELTLTIKIDNINDLDETDRERIQQGMPRRLDLQL